MRSPPKGISILGFALIELPLVIAIELLNRNRSALGLSPMPGKELIGEFNRKPK